MAKKPHTADAAAPAPAPADAAAPAPAEDVAPPARIKMIAPHGFIDEDGTHRLWQQGQEVFDPADIALLAERGARFEPVA